MLKHHRPARFSQGFNAISSEYLSNYNAVHFRIMPIIVFVIANHRLKQKRYAYLAALFFMCKDHLYLNSPGLLGSKLV